MLETRAGSNSSLELSIVFGEVVISGFWRTLSAHESKSSLALVSSTTEL